MNKYIINIRIEPLNPLKELYYDSHNLVISYIN